MNHRHNIHGGADASHRSNSAHFHHLFSSAKPSTTTTTSEDLNEDDIFFTASDPQSPEAAAAEPHYTLRRKPTFQLSSGVLAALPDSTPSSDTHRLPKPLLQRKPSLSATKPIPSIPRPPSEREISIPVAQSAPARKFQHSAPVRVPMQDWRKSRVVVEDFDDEDECDGEEWVPPHEIVARRFGGSSATSFSVLEGVGRTLKGRDLRQVRNAVWRQTGILD